MKIISDYQALSRTTVVSRTTLLLLITIIPIASAFNSKAATASIARMSVRDADTARSLLSHHTSRMHRNRVRVLSSTAPLPRNTLGRKSIATSLQFSDNASSNATIEESSWWRKLFTVSSHLPKYSPANTSSSSDVENEEQDNVDAYLEFLDRRYRRLHSDEKREEKSVSQQRLGLKKGKPFSAMDWLTTGGNDNKNSVTTSQEQQADALYILGVAGLASEKLLQKHHLPTHNKLARQSTKNSSDSISLDRKKADELNEQNDAKSNKIIMNKKFVEVVLLPIVRIIYIAQLQKQLVFKMVHQNMAKLTTKLMTTLTKNLNRSPQSVAIAMLQICGGRKNIIRTMSIGYATIAFFRPILQAMIQ